MVQVGRALAALGFVSAAVAAPLAHAQPVATLVKDINPGFTSSIPNSPPVVANDLLFFFTDDGQHGRELWKSDGTEAGTVLVKDIYPDMAIGTPYAGLVAVGDQVYFAGTEATTGTELWKSDGTEAGTTMVKDIETTSSMPDDFLAVNDRLFFIAGLVGQRALYVSDGTADGTIRLVDSDNGRECAAVGGLAYCALQPSLTTLGLFKSDGTVEGTVAVAPGVEADTPFGLTPFGNELFFYAYEAVHGTELWKTDGTEAGTTMVKDCAPGERSGVGSALEGNYVVFDGGFLFLADGGQGSYMWITDGTEAGTVPLGNPLGPNVIVDFRWIVSRGQDVVFKGSEPETGRELWKSDGTAAGTVMIKDINPGRDSGIDAAIGDFLLMGDIIFFVADDGTHGPQVWRSNGTEESTVRLTSFTPSFERNIEPAHLRYVGGKILFFADDGAPGAKLWSIDPNAPAVTDDGTGGTGGSGTGGSAAAGAGGGGQGGSAASGGAETGGAPGGTSSGGAGGASAATGGTGGDEVDDSEERSGDSGSCGCRTVGGGNALRPLATALLLAGLALRVRARRTALRRKVAP